MTEKWDNKETLSYLISFGYQMAGALDAGKFGSISYQEAKDHIDNGTIFSLLQERIGDVVDLSLWTLGGSQEKLLAALQDRSAVGRDRRYYSVENDGLCLLSAYAFSAINYITREQRS